MLQPNKTYIDDETEIAVDIGVMQGGKLSPYLFNLTMDMILKSNNSVKEMLIEGKLIAYANDIAIMIKEPTLAIELI
jgi:hypothetical protein